MCRLPVILGGGITMDQGSLPLEGAASKALESSHTEYQRVCAVLKSKALSISRMCILVWALTTSKSAGPISSERTDRRDAVNPMNQFTHGSRELPGRERRGDAGVHWNAIG